MHGEGSENDGAAQRLSEGKGHCGGVLVWSPRFLSRRFGGKTAPRRPSDGGPLMDLGGSLKGSLARAM